MTDLTPDLLAGLRVKAEAATSPVVQPDVIEHGDPEPSFRPYKSYLGGDGKRWNRQLLGGWRCPFDEWSHDWATLPASLFPLVEVVAPALPRLAEIPAGSMIVPSDTVLALLARIEELTVNEEDDWAHVALTTPTKEQKA